MGGAGEDVDDSGVCVDGAVGICIPDTADEIPGEDSSERLTTLARPLGLPTGNSPSSNTISGGKVTVNTPHAHQSPYISPTPLEAYK
jgi:hypothetical protein